MKIITILLLMISTQAQAMANTAEGGLKSFTVEQCNQIANISKRTIKAAIIGVPIAEVINKFTQGDWTHQTGEAAAGQFVWTEDLPYDIASSGTQDGVKLNNWRANGDGIQAIRAAGPITYITAIYKTVDQIKTKYGQVRSQDIARLNNRVEQKLRECREMAGIAEDFFFQEHAIIKKP